MEASGTVALAPDPPAPALAVGSPGLVPPPHATDPMAQLALLGGSGGDMMNRFEALSRLFRSEVEGLVGQEQAASRETAEQLQARIAELEAQVAAQTAQAQRAAARLRGFVGERQAAVLARVFGPEPPPEPQVSSVDDLGEIIEAFVCANEEEHNPELAAAQGRVRELEERLAAREAELAATGEELREARVLKSQEERELAEFKALRDKESDLQDCQMKLGQLQADHEELQAAHKVLTARASQSEASLGDKSRKLISLMQQLEEQTEQCRLLSNENNTLRLQLGKDSEYLKVVQPPEDPLSCGSKAGALSEELQREERRMREELAVMQSRFPGLPADSENCRGWCGAQISRHSNIYRSFLRLLQDFRQDAPVGTDIEFINKAQEVDAAWIKREEEFRGADAAFQERERAHTKKWEEKRLQLTAERDAKVKELLERAEKAQTKAESQLLMQQARLFGQRLDAQIERAWEEQRKERDARWAEHNQAKQESRQKFKDESLSVQQQADGAATASDRFQDMARARLAGVEDAWARKVEKNSTVSAAPLRDGDLAACLRAAGLEHPSVPPEGIMYAGISTVSDTVEELMTLRFKGRRDLCKELEEQTLQQLRVSVEKFVQKEGVQQRKAAGGSAAEEEERAPEYTQAATIRGLLHGRQHRVVADTVRRQFQDFLLAIRIASLAAARLLQGHVAEGFRSRGARLDLPPLPQELGAEAAAAAAALPAPPGAAAEEAAAAEPGGDELLEGRLLYEALLRRLLERLLTPLHAQHREELLGLKRANAREVRLALQHLCQLEAESVDKAAAVDLEEYRGQIRTKLLSDCEYHICEERRQLSEQVDEDVEMHVRKYQRQAAEEEVAALRDRRKWLTERLVVMQSQGAISPGDRAVMQHLRNELRACEAKFEQRERELAPPGSRSATPPPGAAAPAAPAAAPARAPAAAAAPRAEDQLRAPRAQFSEGANVGTAATGGHAPAPVDELPLASQWTPAPPPAARPSSRGSSPRPRPQGTPGRSGRSPAPAPVPAPVPQAAAPPPPPAAALGEELQASPPCRPPSFGGPVPGAGSGRRSQPGPAPPQSPRHSHRRPVRQTRSHSPSFGQAPDRGASPSFGCGGDTPDVLAEAVAAAPPLYEWPFEAGVMCSARETGGFKTARSLSASKLPESKLPESRFSEVLPPLRPPLARSGREVMEEGCCGGHSYSAGISMGAPPPGPGAGRTRSPRPAPHLLPPVPTPRGGGRA